MTNEEMYNFENSILKQMESAGMTKGEARTFAGNLERRVRENDAAIENSKPFVLYSHKKN